MISDRLRAWSRWLVEPIARALHRLGFTPNVLTVLGFLLSFIPAALLATGRLPLAGVLILVCSALDAFDGTLARLSGRATTFGAFLDSVLDRFSEGIIYFGLIAYCAQTGRQEELYLTYAAIIGSQLVSYTRARAEGLGLRCTAGWFSRVERIIGLSVGLMVGWLRPVLWLLAILTNLTALQRMVHVYRATRGEEPRAA
ncbi:MAG TPA: CDP-alcohol phosphatidyltransferase family protein [Anaerolineae bacterium]|nr:CDP-alcohol phosphatidyltransferase family protein [Anaerolineae bacterium]HOR00784.1 CDP-alcohol phosphatidyltransferase family protein [Anaerolineae bacterium]HPL28129.1 CDP-alcohol phosphatidyltransferase family protein [Anaerolineae bacterium]